MYSMQILYFK